ncbi:hypothetical protein Cgig2_019256 [Carnegiea gigantea]|uniref:Uncharacterized protein n=1 Tax=Carnegiea gigantea TaxID=171969 RepID=A0A9Q1KMZ8_9CARY|nr:hypothetical protein Cgig2_019256 [Carnegiea gigantea]
MGEGKQGLMLVEAAKGLMPPQNPLVQIQNKYIELETGFKSWLSKQPIYVEAAAATVGGAAQGALLGALMGTLTQDMSSSLPLPPTQAGLDPKAMASFRQAQALSGGPLVQARNFAVMTGVNIGISTVLKRLKGKEDVQSSKKDGMNSSPTDFTPEEVRTKRMAIRMGHTPLARFSSVC